MQGSVTVHFAAPPAEVWALVSDVTRIGEFSPETFEARARAAAHQPDRHARHAGEDESDPRGV